MNLEIITPDQNLFSGEVSMIKVPGTNGIFTILNNHASIISTLTEGSVIIKTESDEQKDFPIESGMVEVKKNKIIILAETR